MNFLTTDQPPLQPLLLVHTKTTDQPPHSQTRQQLAALSDRQLLVPQHFWLLNQLLEQGQPTPIAARRTKAYVSTTARDVELGLLETVSPGPMLALVCADFWSATRVSGLAWSAAGIGQSSVGLMASGASQTWRHDLPAVAATLYQKSVDEVAQTVATAPADTQTLVKAQSHWAQLFMPLALGMHQAPDKYRYTSLVVDAVLAVLFPAVQRLKHLLRVPRPYDTGAFVNTQVEAPNYIDVPRYSAYPSGHATVMAALATVLADLVEAGNTERASLMTLATSIAKNRERAGLHTALDTEAGLALGQAFGDWMIQAVADPAFLPWAALYAAAAKEWDPGAAPAPGATRASSTPKKK